MKIINPRKKSDAVMWQLRFNSRFESLLALRVKLIEEFQDCVPNTVVFNVGYFEGQQHSKISIVNGEDLNAMYSRYPKGEITLWCDSSSPAVGQEASSEHGKRKREDVAASTSRRQEKEEEVDAAFKELKEKHADVFDVPKLRLWARMIASNLHDDYETPPNVPAFQGNVSKKCRQQSSLSDAVSGAAVAFANALKGGNSVTTTEKASGTGTHSISSSKAIDLRMKNFEQLRYLQQLFDDNILSENEYSEQKQNILSTLKNLR